MITFAIPTNIKSNEQKELLDALVYSIESQSVQVPYEILVCGNYSDDRVTTLDFPEDLNGTAYITRKQNLLLDNAKYENIVFLRDYEFLWNDWVDGFLYWNTLDKNNWNIMMSPVLNKDGSRYRDVCHWYPDETPTHYLPPYKDVDISRFYINGGYFVCKKEFLSNVRWNDSLQLGEAEDIDLSFKIRYRHDFKYCFNPYSIVQLQKQKDRLIRPIPHEYFGTLEYVMSNYKRKYEQ
jgi:hypothetical protein